MTSGKTMYFKLDPLTGNIYSGVQFDYEWGQGQVHTIGWRPCLFPHLATESAVKPGRLSSCGRCGVPISTSFIKPAWLSASSGMDKILPQTKSMQHSPIQQPSGLGDDVARSICRCFDMLKRRCLQKDVPVDHIDSQRFLEGSLPVISRVQGLPAFWELLELASKNCDSLIVGYQEKAKSICTRGVNKPKGVDRSTAEKLSKSHFLPPWLKSQSVAEAIRKSKPMHHETLLTFPNACIELIRTRIQNGYYRSESAVRSDLVEAYVSSVLYVLSGPATRQSDPLSIRKLAKFLSSPKGNSSTNSLIANIRNSLTKKKLSNKTTSKKVVKKPGERTKASNDMLVPLHKKKTSATGGQVSKKKSIKLSAGTVKQAAEVPKKVNLEKRSTKQGAKKAAAGKNSKKKATVEKTNKKPPERMKSSSDADSPFAKEKGLVDRIDGVRRLYAMVRNTDLLFGVCSTRLSI